MPLDTMKTRKIIKDNKVKAEPKKGINYLFFFATSIAGILIGVIFAYNLKWIGDDIFIGLRYVENFLAGNGLVYNVGERVEGYTDFLWLMMISFFQYLKFDPAETSIYMGLFFAIGTLLVITFISFKLNTDKGLRYFIPLSLFMLAFNYDFAVWATGGLETMFYTFLLISTFGVYFFSKIKPNQRLFICGLLMCFALLTRPDAVMFFGIANIFLLLRNIILKTPVKKLITEQLLFSWAAILIYIPYFIWRYNYYGQFFPNTYYSKAAYLSFYQRGFYYLWLYFQCHFTAFLFFLSIPVLLNIFINGQGASKERSFRNALLSIINNNQLCAFTVAVISVSFYLIFFVAKVGGDFMYARFVIPCVPLICYTIEYSLYDLPIIKYKKRYGFIVLLLLSATIAESINREDFFLVDENGKKVTKEKEGIADEHYMYTNQTNLDLEDKLVGIALRPYFQDLDATILMRGGQACLVYYGKFKTCLENHGLTDTFISHLPVKERGGKIAHEKSAPYDYILKRGVNFVFHRSHYKKDGYRNCLFNFWNFKNFNIAEGAEIITYDRKIINALKERLDTNFKYTNFENYLDHYILTEMPSKSKEDIKKDYEDFKEYYFLHNDDKEREAKFLSKI